MPHIIVTAGPSSGKTTLLAELAAMGNQGPPHKFSRKCG
jgi:predicted ATPase